MNNTLIFPVETPEEILRSRARRARERAEAAWAVVPTASVSPVSRQVATFVAASLLREAEDLERKARLLSW